MKSYSTRANQDTQGLEDLDDLDTSVAREKYALTNHFQEPGEEEDDDEQVGFPDPANPAVSIG